MLTQTATLVHTNAIASSLPVAFFGALGPGAWTVVGWCCPGSSQREREAPGGSTLGRRVDWRRKGVGLRVEWGFEWFEGHCCWIERIFGDWWPLRWGWQKWSWRFLFSFEGIQQGAIWLHLAIFGLERSDSQYSVHRKINPLAIAAASFLPRPETHYPEAESLGLPFLL